MKDTNTIPLYDLNGLSRSIGIIPLHDKIMALPFSDYVRIQDKMNIPHRHNFYHIRLFTKGSGAQTIDFDKFKIQPGQIYFMIPGQVHCWDYTDDLDGYSVNFSENIFRSIGLNPNYLEQFTFFRGIPNDSVIDLKEKALDEVTYYFKHLVDEINNKDSFSMEMVCFDLLSLFISISRHMGIPVNKQSPMQNQNTLYKFRTLLNKHYVEKRSPKDYAAMLYITHNQLNAVCNNCLGRTAGELIREKIVLEAKRLLVNTDLSISEIADKLNFNDRSYFTKFFKKYTNVTPEEFKKSLSNSIKNIQ